MDPLYSLSGEVIQGKKRGKRLGFPTANIILSDEIPEGIYAAKVIIDGKEYSAATFIGVARMFNETELKVESYILDFNKDIYGKKIIVNLFRKIRKNKRFKSASELIEQIKKDVEETRKTMESNSQIVI